MSDKDSEHSNQPELKIPRSLAIQFPVTMKEDDILQNFIETTGRRKNRIETEKQINLVKLEDLNQKEREEEEAKLQERENDLLKFWKKKFKPLKGRMRDDFEMLGKCGIQNFDILKKKEEKKLDVSTDIEEMERRIDLQEKILIDQAQEHKELLPVRLGIMSQQNFDNMKREQELAKPHDVQRRNREEKRKKL